MASPARHLALRPKALAIARELGAAEASRATGISPGTIRSWLSREKTGAGKTTVGSSRRTPKRREAEEAVARAAMDQARAEASRYVADRLKEMADRLYDTSRLALARVVEMLREYGMQSDGKTLKTGGRGDAAWLRSLTGVVGLSIDKAQLLAGKPTERTEVLTADEARERLTGRLDELDARRREKAAAGGAA
jgi:hypothetical protein